MMNDLNRESLGLLLNECRKNEGSAEKVDQLIIALSTNEDLMDALGTSRAELQELLWNVSGSSVRVADTRLITKKRSGSSFDRGSYNFG